MSRSVMPRASIRATPAAIWSIRPCIRSRVSRRSSAIGASAGRSVARPGRRGAVAATAAAGQDLVAQADQLGALLGSDVRIAVELRDRGIGGVDVVEAGHRPRF